MNWYIAKLIFRIVCAEGRHQPQFDEQLRLVSASDETEALQKTEVIIAREQDHFLNGQQQTVRWEFINLAELYKIDDLADGAELYYNIIEVENADDYIDMINQKALQIKTHYYKKPVSI